MNTTPLPPLEKRTPEQHDLIDYLYEYGVSAEGVHQRLEKVCQAYATQARADLEAENKRLREALELFDVYVKAMESDDHVAGMLAYGQFEDAARAALETKP